MKKYDKLVRDKIPTIIRESGSSCKTRTIKSDEIETYYRRKIQEELDELFENPCAEEMADLMEVVDSLRTVLDLRIEKVIDVKCAKRNERGTFKNGTILIHVEE
jgi:predicted house-cleaning noncanonical NTP pyrophosphatase (MazG superfamily)